MGETTVKEGIETSEWKIEYQFTKIETSLEAYAENRAHSLYEKLEKAAERLGLTSNECISEYVMTSGLINSNPDTEIPLKANFVIGSGFVSYLALVEAIKHEHQGNILNVFGALSYAVGVAETLIGMTTAKSELMKSYAELRLRNDPRQSEKRFIKECWQAWQKKPDQYKSKASFARGMIDKCEHLTSHEKIKQWCREWEKEVIQPA